MVPITVRNFAHRQGDDRTQNRGDDIEDPGVQEPDPQSVSVAMVPDIFRCRSVRPPKKDEDGAHGRTDAVHRGLGQIGNQWPLK